MMELLSCIASQDYVCHTVQQGADIFYCFRLMMFFFFVVFFYTAFKWEPHVRQALSTSKHGDLYLLTVGHGCQAEYKQIYASIIR